MVTEAKLNLKRKSGVVSDGPSRAPARSMLRAVGLDDDDMEKPFVAIANLASDVTPCNVHLDRLAQKVKQGVREAGGGVQGVSVSGHGDLLSQGVGGGGVP